MYIILLVRWSPKMTNYWLLNIVYVFIMTSLLYLLLFPGLHFGELFTSRSRKHTQTRIYVQAGY